ncbi:MAG TPA: fused MFS/spermidine synthase [Pseudomonadota bacterium]|nr:fused MFS/spermidine synthase [Pseudomonadota bacterium]HNF96637.1 fused MFS/spermidine synthase [Pseudomonadota bacterium]HNI59514.1 fused MFS/spermidine synthase [Pseudomonadota bacterium]HNN50785.1 fused MFS/spermidine synthase [Pseudomonadota bacterium]HNO68529.1 fused MFS/spermidine synthase [Pseudomonadota bacterium]
MEFLVFLCFLLSGGSGLLFEVLWTRELQLVFGSTTLAMSTVLSVFMGGLALGSLLGGRLAPKVRRPLVAYALVEAGVGLYALLLPLFLARYPALNAALWRTVGDHFVFLSALRFLATALVLIIPTTLMGATLPLLSQYVAQKHAGIVGTSVQIGTLFAMNTTGAVVGTFLSGFVLLPRFGVSQTNLIGACTNLSLAALILFGSALYRAKPLRAAEPEVPDLTASDEESSEDEAQADAGVEPSPLYQRRLAVLSYAISGATAMVYQVLWTRALAIIIGSSVYSFTLILLAFLIGLAAGAAIITRLLPRIARPMLWLGSLHALTLVAVGYSYLMFDRLPGIFLAILRSGNLGIDELLSTQFGLSALAILPATLAMGGVMPLTMRIYTGSASGAGHDVGIAYALNTLGAIVGSFAAGFLVLPGLGLQRGLLGSALVTAGLAAMLILVAETQKPGKATGLDAFDPSPQVPNASRRRLYLTAACVMLAAALFAVLSPRWNLTHFAAGLFRVSVARSVVRLHNRVLPDLLYYKDGIATTVSVERWGKTIALKNNGKVDASNSDDMGTQIMVGLLPLLWHKTALDKPPRVAVVGYGSGVTIGAVTQFPIGHADVVELEPAVVEAGDRYFAEVSHLPSKDPRVRVIIGDGRNFMTQAQGPDDRYDVIVSEPSNPWITGVSNLFTIDYWKLAKSRLADDGVFCQWAQLYELSPVNIKTLLRSFATVFPYTYVFTSEYGSSDMILVATKQPMSLDLNRLRRNFQVPSLRAELSRAGIDRPEEVLADLLLTPDEIWAFSVGGHINTDDNAKIEFAAPRDLLGYMRHESSVPRVHSDDWIYGRFERYLIGHGMPFDKPPAWLPDDGSGVRRADLYAALGRALLMRGKRKASARLLNRSEGIGGGAQTDELSQLLTLFGQRAATEHEEALSENWDGSDEHFADDLGTPTLPVGLTQTEQATILRQWSDAKRYLNRREFVPALRELRDWPMKWIDQMGPSVRLLLGYLLYKADLSPEALDHLAELSDDEEYVKRHPGVYYYLARTQMQSGKPRQAVHNMEQYVKKSPTARGLRR